MGSAVIVIMPPGFGDPSGFLDAPEPVLIEALISEPPVEALTGAVLHGLSGLDEVVANPPLVAPLVEDPTGELRAVVRDDDLGPASFVDDPVQHPPHPKTRQAGVHLDGQTLAGEGVDHVQGPQCSTIGQGVRGEVHGPLLTGPGGSLEVLPGAALQPLSDALPHGKPFLLVEPVDPFHVHGEALPPQEHMKPLITEPLPLGSQFQEPPAQLNPVLSPGLIPIAAPLHPDHPAGPPFAHLKLGPKATHGLPTLRGPQNFFPSRYLRPWLSSESSPTSCFSFRFSSSSPFSRFASATSIPPNLAFHR